MRADAVARGLVRAANHVVNACTALGLVLLLLVGAYSMWDADQVETDASSTQWTAYKPRAGSDIPFADLQRINPDVCAWLSLYGTNIDYPVCAADEADRYLYTNARGEYSLSGALFVDVGTARDFSDPVTIVYGHHMADGAMFGQLDDYADQAFFDEHPVGNLYANGRDWGLQVIAYLETDAYDWDVFREGVSADELPAYMQTLVSHAVLARDVPITAADHVVVMSTCASDGTNGRDLLLAKVTDQTYPDPFARPDNVGTGVDAPRQPIWLWLLVLAALGSLVAFLIVRVRCRRDETCE